MNYQLVLQFPLSESTDFDELIDLETRLMVALAGRHVVDGHDFGSGAMNIFVHTNDPQAAFSDCKPLVSRDLQATLKAAYRKLPGDEYHWVYPKDSKNPFSVS